MRKATACESTLSAAAGVRDPISEICASGPFAIAPAANGNATALEAAPRMKPRRLNAPPVPSFEASERDI
jgi:hypothetical protein